MGATFELRNLPEDLAEQLSRRATLHGCTPEQEVLRLLEQALLPKKLLTPAEVLAEARAAGIGTAAESARMVREDRDAR